MYETIPFAPQGAVLTDIYEESAQFPTTLATKEGLRLFYQSYAHRHDTVKTGVYGEKGLEQVEVISGSGEALYPTALAVDGAEWCAWGEALQGGWEIRVRCRKNGSWGEIRTVAKDEALFYPRLCAFDGKLLLFYTRQYKGGADALCVELTENGATEPKKVSQAKEVYRPNACVGGDGRLYLTYDAYMDGAYHTLARVLNEGTWSEELRLDNTAEWTTCSTVIPAPAGATVVWYTFGYGATFSICSADLSRDGKFAARPAVTITNNVGWYMDIAAQTAPDGVQVLAYTWGKDKVQARIRRPGQDWTLGAQVSFEDIHCAVHPSLLIPEKDTILLSWQFALRNGHYDRNAQAVLTRFTPEDIEKRGNPQTETAENTFCLPIHKDKDLPRRTDGEVSAWLARNGYTGKLLFGDIHGQSGISDGMGTIDQYYHRSRDKADLQFSCLTDHDCYPDWISQSEWELMRTTARLMNEDDALTCLLSFEWTPNEFRYDFGHKNVYYRDDNGDIFRSGDQGGITPTNLYASLKNYRAMCIPHHPAADWGMVSAATDWDFHDDSVERLAEIFSRHAPYEDDESRSKFTKNIKKMPHHSVQEALSKGYRMGFTAGSDSHQMEHGVEGGIVAAFTPTHDREGIWDAMYARHTYGTTGARILVSLKIDGHMMGSELTRPVGKSVDIDISVLGTSNVKVDLLRNNQVLKTWEPGSDCLDVSLTDTGVNATDWYYVRVTQPDEHMAWSSPIWIDRA